MTNKFESTKPIVKRMKKYMNFKQTISPTRYVSYKIKDHAPFVCLLFLVQ